MKHQEYSGKIALVRYIGWTAGGDLIEDHSQGEPIEIVIGAGEVPLGVEEALYEMEIGETGKFDIPCEKAYGAHDPEGVQTYLRALVPGGDKVQEGDYLVWKHPVSKADVPVRCTKATLDTITIDFNHLLAGVDLVYQFELVDVLDEWGNSLSGTGVRQACAS